MISRSSHPEIRSGIGAEKWWIRPDLNRGPGDYESPVINLKIGKKTKSVTILSRFLFAKRQNGDIIINKTQKSGNNPKKARHGR